MTIPDLLILLAVQLGSLIVIAFVAFRHGVIAGEERAFNRWHESHMKGARAEQKRLETQGGNLWKG